MATKITVLLLLTTGLYAQYPLNGEARDEPSLEIQTILDSLGIIYDSSSHVSYIAGNMNLILAAPHGGYLKPRFIPDRTAGCFVNGTCVYLTDCEPKDIQRCYATTEHDDNTLELTLLLSYEINKLTGKAPHLVINNLARVKLDANRERNLATFGNPAAILAYDKFHNSIENAKSTFKGPGLFLDIHGQSHPIQRTEMGYMITANDLDDNILDPSVSSIKALAGRVNTPFEELLRGQNSLGGMLEKEGFRAVPSPTDPGPKGAPYFYGEYDVDTHGSHYGGDVDGIMAESAISFRKPDMIKKYARSFASAIVNFMKLYYHLESTTNRKDLPKENSNSPEPSHNSYPIGNQQVQSPFLNIQHPTESTQPESTTKYKKNDNSLAAQPARPFASSVEYPNVDPQYLSAENESTTYIITDKAMRSTEYNRAPVLISAGIFAVVASIILIIVGVWYRRRKRPRHHDGYISLNDEDSDREILNAMYAKYSKSSEA